MYTISCNIKYVLHIYEKIYFFLIFIENNEINYILYKINMVDE